MGIGGSKSQSQSNVLSGATKSMNTAQAATPAEAVARSNGNGSAGHRSNGNGNVGHRPNANAKGTNGANGSVPFCRIDPSHIKLIADEINKSVNAKNARSPNGASVPNGAPQEHVAGGGKRKKVIQKKKKSKVGGLRKKKSGKK